MQYFYLINKNLTKEKNDAIKKRIKAYKNSVVFVEIPCEDMPEFISFPTSLLINGYHNKKECTIILDTTYQVSKDDSKFINLYCQLYDLNVKLEFYRFPFISSSNVEKLAKISHKNITGAIIKPYIESQFNTFKDYIIEQNRIGRSKTKEESEKSKKIKDFIISHSDSFNGKLSDADLLKLIEKNKNKKSELYFGRMTFYRYKKELLENK